MLLLIFMVLPVSQFGCIAEYKSFDNDALVVEQELIGSRWMLIEQTELPIADRPLLPKLGRTLEGPKELVPRGRIFVVRHVHEEDEPWIGPFKHVLAEMESDPKRGLWAMDHTIGDPPVPIKPFIPIPRERVPWLDPYKVPPIVTSNSVDVVLADLDHPDSAVRWHAIECLTRSAGDDQRFISSLPTRVNDRNRSVAMRAAESLKQLGRRASAVVPQIYPIALRREIAGSGDSRLFEYLVANYESAATLIDASLDSADLDEATFAATLKQRANRLTADDFPRAARLLDQDTYREDFISELLIDIDQDRAFELSLRRLEDATLPTRNRFWLIDRCAQNNRLREIHFPSSDRAIQILIRLLDDPNLEVATAAAKSLGEWRSAAAAALPRLRAVRDARRDELLAHWADLSIHSIESSLD